MAITPGPVTSSPAPAAGDGSAPARVEGGLGRWNWLLAALVAVGLVAGLVMVVVVVTRPLPACRRVGRGRGHHPAAGLGRVRRD